MSQKQQQQQQQQKPLFQFFGSLRKAMKIMSVHKTPCMHTKIEDARLKKEYQ